jgi:hypothetical protein
VRLSDSDSQQQQQQQQQQQSQAQHLAAVADMRVSYEKHGLLEGDAAGDPLQQFDSWFKSAVEGQVGCYDSAVDWATHLLRAWPMALTSA